MNQIGSQALFNRNGSKIGLLDGSGVFRDVEGRCLGLKMEHSMSNRIMTMDNFSTGCSLGRGGHIDGPGGRVTGFSLGPRICGSNW